jgi:hypothetical protein
VSHLARSLLDVVAAAGPRAGLFQGSLTSCGLPILRAPAELALVLRCPAASMSSSAVGADLTAAGRPATHADHRTGELVASKQRLCNSSGRQRQIVDRINQVLYDEEEPE